jgi:hypothetical protein
MKTPQEPIDIELIVHPIGVIRLVHERPPRPADRTEVTPEAGPLQARDQSAPALRLTLSRMDFYKEIIH